MKEMGLASGKAGPPAVAVPPVPEAAGGEPDMVMAAVAPAQPAAVAVQKAARRAGLIREMGAKAMPGDGGKQDRAQTPTRRPRPAMVSKQQPLPIAGASRANWIEAYDESRCGRQSASAICSPLISTMV